MLLPKPSQLPLLTQSFLNMFKQIIARNDADVIAVSVCAVAVCSCSVQLQCAVLRVWSDALSIALRGHPSPSIFLGEYTLLGSADSNSYILVFV